MTTLSIQPPFPLLTDIDGQPLEDGYIWIGVANLPPIGNPIAVYWDAALTQPAALPVRTRGGYPVNNGTPARLYVNSDYSIQVQNKNGSVLYSAPDGASDRFSSAQISFLQAGTSAVVRTAQSKMRETVSVKDFGAVGDVVVDDTSAIRAAAARIQTLGGGSLLFPPGRYRVFSDGSTTALAAFSSLDGISIEMDGAEIVVDRTFTGSQEVTCFEFNACSNIAFRTPFVSCTQTQPLNQKTSRGVKFASFLNGCRGVVNDVARFQSLRIGWYPFRDTGEAESYVSTGFDLGVTLATNTGYPLLTSRSGYQLKATLVTDACGRSYFPQGAQDHEVSVLSKNHEASVDCLIATELGEGMNGLVLNYSDTESTTADNSINSVRLEFQDSETYVGAHRNIKVNLNIKTTASAWQGSALQVGKALADGTPDPTDRGHILENIEVVGTIIGGNANQRTLNICGPGMGTWGAGENIRNIRIRNLRMSGTLATGPIVNLASLKDVAILDNIYSLVAMDIIGNTTGKIICIGVDCAAELTASTADTSGVDYIGSKIGATTNQSITNKNFINTYFGSTLYKRNPTQFRAFRNTTDQIISDQTFTIVQFNSETFDPGSNFDSTTNYRFTAPTAGWYCFHAQATVSTNLADGDAIFVSLFKNGAEVTRGALPSQQANGSSPQVMDVLSLAAGDTVDVRVFANQAAGSGAHDIAAGSSSTFFCGFEV